MNEPVVLAAAEMISCQDDEPADWYLNHAQALFDVGLLTDRPVVAEEAGNGSIKWRFV